jgi:hypothetical protein
MNVYTVTVKASTATEPDAFAGLHDYDEDAVVEFVDATVETETYTITTERNIDLWLDASAGVIQYERS